MIQIDERVQGEKEMKTNNTQFSNNLKYDIISGWLIIPAIHTVISLLGSLLIILIANPSTLDQSGTITYIGSAVMVIYLGFTMYAWVKKKKYLPILMMLFYAAQAVQNFMFYLEGFPAELFYMLVSVVLIVYFIRSKRVKATFTN